MIKEIYIRDENDPNFIPGVIEYSNETERIISEIKMILGTEKGDVLGSYDFGVDLNYMVFNTKKTADEVSKEINDQIREYVDKPENIFITTEVSFGDSGEGYDYAIIDILINGQKAIGFLVDKD
jgi:hypothetical protein